MVQPSLESAYAKFDHAKAHLNVLNRRINVLCDKHAASIYTELDEGGTRNFVKTWGVKHPPRGWSLILGDAIQNLRATLDHAVYQLCILESKQDPPPDWRRISFPVAIDETLYWERQAHRIAHVPDGARALIEDMQPWAVGKASNPLWVLNELANTDKHRTLHVASSLLKVLTYSEGQNGEFGVSVVIHGISGELEPEAPIAAFPLQPDMDVDVQAAFDVIFDEGNELVGGRSVRSVMHWLRTTVYVVLETIQPFFDGGQLPLAAILPPQKPE